MSDNYNKQILEKLDQILRVIALQTVGDKSTTDAAWSLKQAGLDNKAIADILNTSTSVIRTLVARRAKEN